MKYKELIDSLKKGEIHNIYLFYGEERFLLSDAIKRFKSKILKEETYEMNYIVIEKNDPEEYVDAIIESCETLPFFSEYKLVVVKNEEDQLSKLSDKSLKKLVNYMEERANMAENKTVLIIVDGEKVDLRKKFYKFIEKTGKIVYFQKLSFEEAVNYTGYFFKKSGKKISKSDAEYLVKSVGTDLYAIVNEIHKVVCYSDSEEIKMEKMKEVLTINLQQNIFNLVSAIGMKKEKEAYKVLYALLEKGEVPLIILSMIVRQMRLIAKIKTFESKFVDKKSIASSLGVPYFVVEELTRQSKFFKKEDLERAYKECLKCDIALKSGADSSLALEELVKKLCK
ncbi:DNA polymerase III subunit delta [Thermoanaerobacter brockii subsp. lactiethylicus]|jgi:DNA polymerase-3 subunit delta|uniref:DNA polymerase III subunit delta n=1 Tax=Thermoanaerobacter sp. (strain X514) TaxID=399726 RepID=UPI0001642441|nr:DNA polymerase III subunit delta [Thermoanaerobacter sp. X514]ABY93363.1 DNA polymerase III, delta subunit [Thermoanaerobacter sp. X514]MBZ4655775.1 polymerase delta subunit [Thermoanaerobacter sp.]MDI3528991.1 polymerase subunit delta [Thermoanaerobacter sp.]HCD08799.1 DNA polymerase III subunit delta [Thermoanaerobacter sp.]